MARTLTPSAEFSEITDGQIDKAVALYRAMLIKHRSELASEPAQHVLGQPELVGEMVGVLRKRVEAVSNIIVRHVTSDGRTGDESIRDLESTRYNLDADAKKLLRSKSFVATNGVTYKLAVIRGDEFEDSDRTNANIWAEGERRGWQKPAIEQAALLRELVSDEEIERMGLWALIVMHEPVTDSDGYPYLLGLFRYDVGRWLYACFGYPGYRWHREYGFVFLVPQV